ncbi:hypothetical protein P261_00467 [Lachnospiraceae bacterium TWA4]|nr:hypothetical protein P261_00467 [Lachnospiraceae bacterium TWA4]
MVEVAQKARIVETIMLSTMMTSIVTNYQLNTLKLTVTAGEVDDFIEVLKKKFPEIYFEVSYYEGENKANYLESLVENDEAGDIIFHVKKFNNQICKEKLLDLSNYEFSAKFNESILHLMQVEGKIYQLVGPLNFLPSIGFSSTWALNKKLCEKGNEKKLQNALKVMSFLSTLEGQKSLQKVNPQLFVLKGID